MSKAKATKEKATSDLDYQDLLRMVLVLANRAVWACQSEWCVNWRVRSKHMKCVECIAESARKEAGRVRG